MTIICDALLALNLTLGVFCQSTQDAKTLTLPNDDKKAWATQAPAPKPNLLAPFFPPVIIHEQVAPVATISSPPLPPKQKETVSKKKEPSPYRLALETALSKQAVTADFGTVVNTVDDGNIDLASLTPPSLSPLDLPPPISQDRYESDGQISGLPVDNARILTADRYISGILETGFNSQLDSASGGEVIIQTSRDVFGYHGRNILIPKGSRMICEYGSPGKQGESRIALSCKRILMAGNRAEIFQIAARVGDVQGRAGITGEVDNRFWERYGTAFILAGISAAVRMATATSSTNQNKTSTVGAITDKGAEELSLKLGEIGASVVEQTVNLAPIVTIAQGTRVQIRPAQDWYIQKIGVQQ